MWEQFFSIVDVRLAPSRSARQLISILLTFRNKGAVLKSAFSTNSQSLFVSVIFDNVLGPRPLKCAMSAQKALQGSETRELLGGTDEKSVSQQQ